MKRGDIYRADLDPVVGSEQGGVRPVLIIQNDTGNLHSPTVIVAAITGRHKKPHMPVHVPITAEESGLMADSVTHVDTAAISAQVNALIESLRQEIQSVKDGSAYLMRSGGEMTGPINMNGQAIKGLNAPTEDDEAVNWGSVKDLGKASSVTVTLAASGWVNNSQTVNVSGVTKDAAVIVSSAPENLDDYLDAGVYCSASDDGTLTFQCKDVPAISLSVNVVLLGVSVASAAYPAAEGGSF
jgi:mRNA-degrading endonuclease toxin of MazEF toxin-antitoxin module